MILTAHAEINAIRKACKKLRTNDFIGLYYLFYYANLAPMCFSAIHWAKIKAVVYGHQYCRLKKLGFNELAISNTRLKKLGKAR